MQIIISGRKDLRLVWCDQFDSCPIRLQDSLIISISESNKSIQLNFLHEVTINRRKDQGLPLLDRCDQLCHSSSQIAGLSDHQYLWKESINTLDFFA